LNASLHQVQAKGDLSVMDTTALIDIDGTLMNSNLLYVLAWRRAFQRVGKQIVATSIVHKIGMSNLTSRSNSFTSGVPR
jgi:beta-phosphoglucomutase-like phosphatase (HAD superfamily)